MDTVFLDIALKQILEQESLSEFELIQRLQTEPYSIFNDEVLKDDLSLFQTHFVLQNALYRLRDRGIETRTFDLDILPTKIQMYPVENSTNYTEVNQYKGPETEKLRAYYLDWKNFEDTDQQAVEQLLESFWQKLGNYYTYSQQDIEYALVELELSAIPSQHDLKKQYKKLSLIHHPDKGGDVQTFKQLNKHYQIVLNHLLNQSD